MNRTQNYTIRFTPREWEGIVTRANNKDMRVSDYIRLMIDIGEKKDHIDMSSSVNGFTW